MRLLTIADELEAYGGLERVQLNTARGLAARRHRVDVVHTGEGHLSDQWSQFARTIQVPKQYDSDLRSPGRLAQFALAAARCRLSRPDAVLYCDWPHASFAHAVAQGTKAQLAFQVHLNFPSYPLSPRYQRGLAATDTFITVSRFTADSWIRSGVDPKRVCVVHNGVDTIRFRPPNSEERRAARLELGIDDERFVVLYAGRVDSGKGVETLLEALALLGWQSSDAQLVVAGDPTLHATVEAGIAYRDALQRAAPQGTLFISRRHDVIPLMWAADLLVVPSMPDTEALPVVAIEGLSCGLPVIASATGGLVEIFEGGLEELTFRAGDANSLSERLRDLYGWRDKDPALATKCRAHVSNGFSVRSMVERTELALGWR